MIKLYRGDCLDIMPSLPDNSVDLVVIDPPYNINKDHWDKIDNYIEWMGSVFLEIQRVIKDNGSFYFFHNDFLKMVELQNWINKNSKFIFKQLITWDKLTHADTVQIGSLVKGYGGLRTYFKGSTSEYILKYIIHDDIGMTLENIDDNNFSELRKYFKGLLCYINLTKKEIVSIIGQSVDHCFRWKSSQWDIPTENTYKNLIKKFNIDRWDNFIDYGELKKKYFDYRYTFNKKHFSIKGCTLKELKNNLRNSTCVWDHERDKKNYKTGHVSPKPVRLIENMIEHSSNENDIVLDCFTGTGSTGVACVNTNRNFIGIEKDEEYFKIADKRIKEAESLQFNSLLD